MRDQRRPDLSAVRNLAVYVGVVLLAAAALVPVFYSLYGVLLSGSFMALPGQGMGMRIGWVIVAVGFVISAMVVLLRLRVRGEDDRDPPLAPALAIVGIGAALVAVTALGAEP